VIENFICSIEKRKKGKERETKMQYKQPSATKNIICVIIKIKRRKNDILIKLYI
jgi:hypothetical protein